MSTLTYVEKEQMAKFFGIEGGYAFIFLKKGYNKTNTRNIILEATGIDIYQNPEYNMSQEKCIRKIWDECDNYTVGCLLKTMLDYYLSVSDWDWSSHEEITYESLRELEKRLIDNSVVIPVIEGETFKTIKEDIERNCRHNTPELALDRLHNFSTQYLRRIWSKHSIDTHDEQGKELPIHSLAGKLKNWYKTNHYFDSDFSVVAIQNSIIIFDKYNEIRNDQSAAHPNEILNKVEAMFAVKIICEILTFIEKIEQIKDSENENNDETDIEDNLPF